MATTKYQNIVLNRILKPDDTVIFISQIKVSIKH